MVNEEDSLPAPNEVLPRELLPSRIGVPEQKTTSKIESTLRHPPLIRYQHETAAQRGHQCQEFTKHSEMLTARPDDPQVTLSVH